MSEKALWAVSSQGTATFCSGRKTAMSTATERAQQHPGCAYHVMKTIAILSAPIPTVGIVELGEGE